MPTPHLEQSMGIEDMLCSAVENVCGERFLGIDLYFIIELGH